MGLPRCEKERRNAQTQPQSPFPRLSVPTRAPWGPWAVPATPSPVGRGIRGCPPLCLRRSCRALWMRAQLQPLCQTGSSRPLMHCRICSFSWASRSPRACATYVMNAMSMFTASPCISDGKTLCNAAKGGGTKGLGWQIGNKWGLCLKTSLKISV